LNGFEISKLQEEYTIRRDDREFSLGDTLDVKTSVILAVIVFLAAQTDAFFQSGLIGWPRYFQYCSVVALILGGIFAVLELRPRNYQQEDSPVKYDEWIEKLRLHYAKTENMDAEIFEQAVLGRIQRARERAEQNIIVNQRKSDLLHWAFWCTVISLAANLATLVIRLF
jgi:hypothetical protein